MGHWRGKRKRGGVAASPKGHLWSISGSQTVPPARPHPKGCLKPGPVTPWKGNAFTGVKTKRTKGFTDQKWSQQELRNHGHSSHSQSLTHPWTPVSTSPTAWSCHWTVRLGSELITSCLPGPPALQPCGVDHPSPRVRAPCISMFRPRLTVVTLGQGPDPTYPRIPMSPEQRWLTSPGESEKSEENCL